MNHPEEESPKLPLHVVLVHPEIAGNVGAVGRTCVAVGAELWLVRPLGFHLTDRHLKRAGMDYWEHLRVHIVDAIEEVAEALAPGRLWSFTTKADRVYSEVEYRPGDALVFGSEGHGLSEAWRTLQGDRCVRIPMRPEARSLNLSNSVAVALYEAVRQVGGGTSAG